MVQPVLIITGASRGIGAATARLAGCREGYAVAVNYRSQHGPAAAVVDTIRAAGGQAVAIQADTSNEDDVLRLFERCERDLGPVSHLVNNAGITGPYQRLEELQIQDLDRVMAVNVRGYFLCAREAVRRLSTQRGGPGGAIVNVSSRAAELGGAEEWIHYAASKGATDSLTIGLAKEMATCGVRVNAVNPGLIETDIHAGAGNGDRVERIKGTVPMQRSGSAEEVAEAILYLLSSRASYITGICMNVGGGR